MDRGQVQGSRPWPGTAGNWRVTDEHTCTHGASSQHGSAGGISSASGEQFSLLKGGREENRPLKASPTHVRNDLHCGGGRWQTGAVSNLCEKSVMSDGSKTIGGESPGNWGIGSSLGKRRAGGWVRAPRSAKPWFRLYLHKGGG